MWNKLRNHFASGLLVLGPLFLTFIFIGYLVRLVDRMIVNPVFRLLPFVIDATFKVVLTKILIAVVVVFLVSVIGLAAERFLFKRFVHAVEQFFGGIPVFNKIYSSIKEIAQAFFGGKTGVFKRVVFLEYPRKGIWAMGFVTQEQKRWEICERTGKDMISVFVPSPPNPATGFFIFVPKEELIDAEMTVEEGIKLVISGGAAVPSLKNKI